jgi:hypothetical protein
VRSFIIGSIALVVLVKAQGAYFAAQAGATCICPVEAVALSHVGNQPTAFSKVDWQA